MPPAPTRNKRGRALRGGDRVGPGPQGEPVLVEVRVHGDHRGVRNGGGRHDGRQPDGAETEHNYRLSWLHLGGIEHGPHTRERSTSEHGSDVERHVAVDDNDGLGCNDGELGKRRDAQVMVHARTASIRKHGRAVEQIARTIHLCRA